MRWSDLQAGDRIRFTEEYASYARPRRYHIDIPDSMWKCTHAVELVERHNTFIAIRVRGILGYSYIDVEHGWWRDHPGEPVVFEIVEVAADEV